MTLLELEWCFRRLVDTFQGVSVVTKLGFDIYKLILSLRSFPIDDFAHSDARSFFGG